MSSQQPKPLYNKVLSASALSLLALTLFTGCQSSPFRSEPVPEPLYIPQLSVGETQVLTILAGRVPCDTALPMQCLLAKQDGSEQLFQVPYDWIEGFTPTANMQYTISASPMIDNNLIDNETRGLTGHWVLNSIINQQFMSVQ